MGAVYKARQVSLDRIVALKVLPRRLAQDEQYLGRFLREARAMARLNHRNIVAGFDVNFSDGYNYVVMEFVDGWTLRDWIKQKGVVPERDTLSVGLAMTAALAHAHSAGIIHRDVKPENIIIGHDGTPKLTDLGLSKGRESDDSHLTQSGAVVGTAYYIAPEQARGDATDGRADIYALGCTLYHAATGKTPFDAATPTVLMVKHISEKMRHPQSLRSELSDEFCTLLSHMVAREADDRYATPDEVAHDIEAILNGTPLSREPLSSSASNFLPLAKTTTIRPSSDRELSTALRLPIKKNPQAAQNSRQNRAHARPRPQKSLLMLAGIASVVILGLAALLIYSKMGDSSAAAAASTSTSTTTSSTTNAANSATTTTALFGSVAPAAAELRMPNAGSVERKSVPLTSWLNGRNLDNWQGGNGHWKYENGKLIGSSGSDGVQIMKRGLPGNFELLMTLSVEGTYHFGWSSGLDKGAYSNYFLYGGDGTCKISRYNPDEKSAELHIVAQGDFKLRETKQTLRIFVYDTRMKIFANGRLLLTTNAMEALKTGTRLFLLYSHSNSTLEVQTIAARELGSSAEFDAATATPEPAVVPAAE